MTEKWWTEGGDKGLIIEAQDQRFLIRNYQMNIMKKTNQTHYVTSTNKNESIEYFVSWCSIITSTEYKIGHYIQWNVSKYYGILDREKSYEH